MTDLPDLDFIADEDPQGPPPPPIALTGWETVIFEVEDE
jgi:hypothetical protein